MTKKKELKKLYKALSRVYFKKMELEKEVKKLKEKNSFLATELKKKIAECPF